jgi:hypothetical protein
MRAGDPGARRRTWVQGAGREASAQTAKRAGLVRDRPVQGTGVPTSWSAATS